MTSFYNVLANNIMTAGSTRTREYFQGVIAKWNLNKWLLNDEETTKALALVDQYYPATTTQA